MSNLLEKASILLTPTAYDDGKILSVKPVQSLGVELVVNGDFATDSDWGKISSTISGGTGNLNGTSVSSMLFQDILTNGRTYKVTFTVSNYNGLGNNDVINHNGLPLYILNSNGTFTFTFTHSIANGKIYWRARNGGIFSIDNVSVKELIDADFDFTRNSSATRVNSQGLIEDMQTLSGELVSNGNFSQIGPEQIENGDFATDSDWTKAAGWTISGGTANATSATSGSPLSQYVDVGKTYKITYDVVSLSQGAFQVDLSFSGTALGQLVTTTGTFTDFITSINPALSIRAVGTTTGSITNVSAKEVGQDWSVTGSDANNYVEFNGSTARLKFLNTSPVTQLVSSFVMTAGKKYKLTVDVLTVTSGGIKIDGNGISETFNTPGITTRIINPTGATAIKFYRATANVDITLNSVSLIEITDDTNLPRIDYSPYSGAGTCGHWLFEPQSTNLIPYSEDFTQSTWQKQSAGVASAPVVTSNYSISPDGTLNADRVVFNINAGTTSSDFSQIADQITNNIGDVTNSIWIKSNTTSNYNMSFVDPNANYTSIVVTTEWRRFDVTSTTSSTASALRLRLRGSEATSNSADVSVWGAQVEEQSFATSYIPTSGSTVTRLQDAATGAGSSDLINSTEGVLYFEAKTLVNGETNSNIVLSDGTNNNLIMLRFGVTANRVTAFARGSGGSYSVLTINGVTQTDDNKFALVWDSSNFRVWINGTERSTTTINSIPSGMNSLNFTSSSGVENFFGKTKCVAVFKEALTDAELTCLTTI